MLYRVKQFVDGLKAKLSKEDICFIDKYLDYNEKKFFYLMPVYEQVHSLNVAKQVLKESIGKNIYDIYLIKAAFLHDIGKVDGGLNLFTKSIMVLLDRFTPELLHRFKKIKVVNTYYNHPEIAVKYLDNENEYLIFLIKNHHNYEISADEKLKLLQKADCSN